jgi:hypothetical protein
MATKRIAAALIVLNIILWTLLRLSDPEGRPNVKIGSDGRGAGAAFSGTNPGRNSWYGIQILSQDGESQVKVVNKDGRETAIRP